MAKITIIPGIVQQIEIPSAEDIQNLINTIDEFEARATAIEARLEPIEAAIDQLPAAFSFSVEQINALTVQLNQLSAEVAGLRKK